MKNPLLAPELREILATGDIKTLQEFCEATHPALVAEMLSALEPEEAWTALSHIELALRAEIFAHLDEELQADIIPRLRRSEVAKLFAELPPDDRADLFKQLPEEQQETILPALAQAEREDLRRLSAYKEGTTGAVMTSDYATLPLELTAAEAIQRLRREAPDKETIYYAYVIDEHGRLQGFVSLKRLILAHPDARVGDIMKTNVISIRANEDQEVAFRQIREYDLLALPVINGNDRLVGIVTVDDVLEVVEEEATMDFHKMGTIGSMKMSLKDAGMGILYRARLPWLLILVFMNIFSGAGIAYFEDTLSAMLSLAFFLPLLIDSGGNAGSQAATLMVRALATGDIRMRDWVKLLGREIGVSLALGISMGLAVSLIATFRAPDVVFVVGITMVTTVVFGSLIGMSLPFLLTRLKLDPATSSAPLITSIADIGGVVIYFSIATWWLRNVIATSGL